MELTKEQLEYSQQKNREYIYREAKEKVIAFKFECKDFSKWNDRDETLVDDHYEYLCERANINPW